MKAPWRKKQGTQVSRQLALGKLEDAMGEVQQEPAGDDGAATLARLQRVCTIHGRKAHYEHPEFGILCGWPATEWHAAGDSLERCRRCAERLDELGGEAKAS